jgi:hypothetical protein
MALFKKGKKGGAKGKKTKRGYGADMGGQEGYNEMLTPRQEQ